MPGIRAPLCQRLSSPQSGGARLLLGVTPPGRDTPFHPVTSLVTAVTPNRATFGRAASLLAAPPVTQESRIRRPEMGASPAIAHSAIVEMDPELMAVCAGPGWWLSVMNIRVVPPDPSWRRGAAGDRASSVRSNGEVVLLKRTRSGRSVFIFRAMLVRGVGETRSSRLGWTVGKGVAKFWEPGVVR